MKPSSSELLATAAMRAPVVTSGQEADAAAAVSFDRPLVELPGWGDPRVARQVAEAARAARQQGLAQGYAAGWAQGRRAAAAQAEAEAVERQTREDVARRQVAGQAQAVLASLAQAARTVVEQSAPAWDELVEALLDGALSLAAASLDRELESVDATVLEALRTALRLLPVAEVITVSANPADLALLSAAKLPDGVRLVADPGLPVGSVVTRTPVHTLPVDLRVALRAAEEVLRS
jgi:flagellar assembly protein FliH